MRNPKCVVTTILLQALALLSLSGCSEQSSDRHSDKNINVSQDIIANSTIVVNKTPTCGCCSAWVEYLKEEGFTVEAHDYPDLNPIKASLGMNDPSLYSCHTATVDGYIIEGHVPVADIRKMLSEKPAIAGLTAPGMPMLSPGMNSREPKDYAVLSFTDSGEAEVYSQY